MKPNDTGSPSDNGGQYYQKPNESLGPESASQEPVLLDGSIDLNAIDAERLGRETEAAIAALMHGAGIVGVAAGIRGRPAFHSTRGWTAGEPGITVHSPHRPTSYSTWLHGDWSGERGSPYPPGQSSGGSSGSWSGSQSPRGSHDANMSYRQIIHDRILVQLMIHTAEWQAFLSEGNPDSGAPGQAHLGESWSNHQLINTRISDMVDTLNRLEELFRIWQSLGGGVINSHREMDWDNAVGRGYGISIDDLLRLRDLLGTFGGASDMMHEMFTPAGGAPERPSIWNATDPNPDALRNFNGGELNYSAFGLHLPDPPPEVL